jgi:site-specific recombinase XerD
MSRRAPLSVDRALALFVSARVRAGIAPSTLRLERACLGRCLHRLGGRVASVRAEDVRAYLAARHAEVASNTVARELSTLRAFFAVLVGEGLVRASPVEGFSPKYGPARPPLVLAPVVVARLLAASLVPPGCKRSPDVNRALALRNRACLEVLYGLGLRASEAAAIRVIDLDLTAGETLVRRVKRGEARRLPLAPSSLQHLENYLVNGRPFLAQSGRDDGRYLVTERGTPLRVLQVKRIVNAVAKRAGVRAHPHALRRAVATHLVREGANVVAVQELLGHARLDTTQRYVEVDRADLHRAVAALEGDR